MLGNWAFITIIFSSLIVVALSSCNPYNVSNSCAPHGTCVNTGLCSCKEGWKGSNCQQAFNGETFAVSDSLGLLHLNLLALNESILSATLFTETEFGASCVDSVNGVIYFVMYNQSIANIVAYFLASSSSTVVNTLPSGMSVFSLQFDGFLYGITIDNSLNTNLQYFNSGQNPVSIYAIPSIYTPLSGGSATSDPANHIY